MTPQMISMIKAEVDNAPANCLEITLPRAVLSCLLTEIQQLHATQKGTEREKANIIERMTLEFCLTNIIGSMKYFADSHDFGDMTPNEAVRFFADKVDFIQRNGISKVETAGAG